jgi:hypothetical protein
MDVDRLGLQPPRAPKMRILGRAEKIARPGRRF